MSKGEPKVDVTKEVSHDIGYGFGSTRNLSMKAVIENGKLKSATFHTMTKGESITLVNGKDYMVSKGDDVLKMLELFAAALPEFYELVKKETGEVR